MEANMKGKVIVWNEDFAVVKSKKIDNNSFAIIQYNNEITNVIDQNKINKDNVIEAEKDWKLLTFDMILDFNIVGFISKISKVLADEGISIFVISSYSTDHILVKRKDLESTIRCLEDSGFNLK